jgi:hypothetical protein
MLPISPKRRTILQLMIDGHRSIVDIGGKQGKQVISDQPISSSPFLRLDNLN